MEGGLQTHTRAVQKTLVFWPFQGTPAAGCPPAPHTLKATHRHTAQACACTFVGEEDERHAEGEAPRRQREKQSMSFVFSTFPRTDTDADTVPRCGILRTVLPACSSLEDCIRTLHHKFTPRSASEKCTADNSQSARWHSILSFGTACSGTFGRPRKNAETFEERIQRKELKRIGTSFFALLELLFVLPS